MHPPSLRAASLALLLLGQLTALSNEILLTGKEPILIPGDNELSIISAVGQPPSGPEHPSGKGSSYWNERSGDYHALTSRITTRSSVGKEFQILVKGHYWDNRIHWSSGSVLTLRIWWGRYWGGDYAFDVNTGRFIFKDGFYEPRTEPKPRQGAAPKLKSLHSSASGPGLKNKEIASRDALRHLAGSGQ